MHTKIISLKIKITINKINSSITFFPEQNFQGIKTQNPIIYPLFTKKINPLQSVE